MWSLHLNLILDFLIESLMIYDILLLLFSTSTSLYIKLLVK